jgi:hypothetical protein
MDKLIKGVSNRLPQLNDYLLRDFRKEQINKSAAFIEIVFKEAIKIFKGEIQYIGNYHILSPEERLEYELNNKITKGNVNIRHCEWILVNYQFVYQNTIYPVYIYLPYDFRGYIKINNTNYAVQLSISERVFTKINDGIIVKVIKLPIKFWKNQVFQLKSLSSGKVDFETIITTQIHNKDNRRKKKSVSATVIHYLLCKYGLVKVLEMFNMAEHVAVVDSIDKTDVDIYEYYACQKVVRNKQPLLLKVSKEVMKDIRKKRVVASILYLLTNFNKQTIESLYDTNCTIYKIMLGKIIHGNHTPDPAALNHMDNHMLSLDGYLDPITKQRLEASGIYIQNIYDMLIYIFCNIDKMILDVSHSDLYDKRIDVLDELLVKTIVQSIFYRFYTMESRITKLQDKLVKRLLRLSNRQITKLYKSHIVRMNPDRYNDNWLIGTGIKKVRQKDFGSSATNSLISAPEHRFHPSFAYVESLIAFGTSNPGSTGSINPFLTIDENGFIVKEDYAKQADAIAPYLPYVK